MFTGIVEEVGHIQQVGQGSLTIEASHVLEDTRLGDSISVNGACLTVVAKGRDHFSVNVVPETLAKTNLGLLRVDDPVNLERALRVTDRLGGHLVQGHVEGVGTISAIAVQGEALLIDIQPPSTLLRYIVVKGFIAVDGVSLTVVDCGANSFRVTVIPFTQQHTNLGNRCAGELVNLETDVIARYVEKLVAQREPSRITWDFLAEHGFLPSPAHRPG
jgi:riboflavin synthase